MERGLFKLLYLTVSMPCIDVFTQDSGEIGYDNREKVSKKTFWNTNSSDPIAGPPTSICASFR